MLYPRKLSRFWPRRPFQRALICSLKPPQNPLPVMYCLLRIDWSPYIIPSPVGNPRLWDVFRLGAGPPTMLPPLSHLLSVPVCKVSQSRHHPGQFLTIPLERFLPSLSHPLCFLSGPDFQGLLPPHPPSWYHLGLLPTLHPLGLLHPGWTPGGVLCRGGGVLSGSCPDSLVCPVFV